MAGEKDRKHMVTMTRSALGLAILAMATGCDEFAFDDPPTTDEQAYLALQQETQALQDATGDLAVTPVADLPVVGSATYEGTARIALDPPAGGTGSELIGEASITADFETATLTGQADGFYGTVNGGDVTSFDGTLFLSEGAIDASGAGGDQIGASLNGTLSGGGDTLVVDGGVTGNFLGDPLLLNEPPEALLLETTDDTGIRLNGDIVTGGVQIIGLD
jgi:hypothetical protein